jgi:hypothetical protein
MIKTANYKLELRINGQLIGDLRNIAQNLTWSRCRTNYGVDEIDFTLNDQIFAKWCEDRNTTIDQIMKPYALDCRVIRNGEQVAGGFLATRPAYNPKSASADLQFRFDGYINLLAGVYLHPTATQTKNANIMVNRTSSVPFAEIYLFTDINDPTDNIPTGTYPLALTLEPGTVWAGYRDDEHFEVGGSQFMFTNKAYLAQGYLQPVASWLIADGTMTITESGWTLSGHARNGAPIELRGTTPIQNGGKASSAPKRQKISFVGKKGFNPPAFPLEYASVPLP